MAGGVWKPEDDVALVAAAQQGDPDAFGELYRRHHAEIRRACRRRLCHAADSDDVTQAAFMRAFERIDLCRGERHFGAWVHVIARNLCVDVLRTRAAVEGAHEHRPRPGSTGNETVAVDPEEFVLVAERTRLLRLALDRLPERQRGVLLARAFDDRGPGEIAGMMGLTTGAVDSLLLRARRRLAQAYRDAAGPERPRRAGSTGPGGVVMAKP